MLSILICITLFYHTGLLFDELASNTDNSYVTMTLGSGLMLLLLIRLIRKRIVMKKEEE